MSMLTIVENITNNLGTAPEILLLFMTFGVCLIIAAKDLRLGAIFLLYLTAVEYIILNHFDMTTTYHLILMFFSLVILALTLFISYSRKQGGGYIQ